MSTGGPSRFVPDGRDGQVFKIPGSTRMNQHRKRAWFPPSPPGTLSIRVEAEADSRLGGVPTVPSSLCSFPSPTFLYLPTPATVFRLLVFQRLFRRIFWDSFCGPSGCTGAYSYPSPLAFQCEGHRRREGGGLGGVGGWGGWGGWGGYSRNELTRPRSVGLNFPQRIDDGRVQPFPNPDVILPTSSVSGLPVKTRGTDLSARRQDRHCLQKTPRKHTTGSLNRGLFGKKLVTRGLEEGASL